MRFPLPDAERVAYFWREVVYQGMRDLLLRGEADEEARVQARVFIFDNAKGTGSFIWCCEKAGLDPDEVRKEVLDRIGGAT